MSLHITDFELFWDAAGQQQVMRGPRFVVTARPVAVPVFRRPPDSGPYVEDERALLEPAVDTATARWDLDLPWPSETRSGTSVWTIRRMNGTTVRGAVPEGITGPLAIDDLLFSLSGLARVDGGVEPYPDWQVTEAGTAPDAAVALQPAIIRPRGAWLPDVPYLPGDLVTSGVLTWVALQASAGVQPPAGPTSSATWGLAAATSLAGLLNYVMIWDSPTDPGIIFYKDQILLYE